MSNPCFTDTDVGSAIDAPAKSRAVRIRIDRAEGPSHLCRTHEFTGPNCWSQATAFLWRQSDTFPSKGGYDKHDVTIEWEDGETCVVRMDCQHHSCQSPDLDVTEHVRRFLHFYAGLWRPSHLSDKEAEVIRSRSGINQEDMKRFCETHDINGRIGALS